MERDLPFDLAVKVGKLSVSLEMRSQFGDCEGDAKSDDDKAGATSERELVSA